MASDSGTYCKHCDDSKIMTGFVQFFFILCLSIDTQRFHAASDIADTHGAGKCIAIDFTEGLHLHGTGKGYHGIGQKVACCWKESDHKQ